MSPTAGDSDDDTSESSVWIPRMLPLQLETPPRAADLATCIHQLRHPPNAPGLDLGQGILLIDDALYHYMSL